jgi:hypothetical protein
MILVYYEEFIMVYKGIYLGCNRVLGRNVRVFYTRHGEKVY